MQLHPYQVLQRKTKQGGTFALNLPKAKRFRVLDGDTPDSKTLVPWSTLPATYRSTKGIRVKLPTGGPYTLQLDCPDGIQNISPFFVGDIWVMAGQSNMHGVGLLKDAPAPHPLVMSYTLQEEWAQAREQVNFTPGTPYPAYNAADPFQAKQELEAAKDFAKGTGPGLAFARDIVEKHGIPIGLLPCALGGSSLHQWRPSARSKKGTTLFGAFCNRLESVGGKVAGILWYQGCSEANPDGAKYFTRRMKTLVAAFRIVCGNRKLPFIQVQLNGFYDTNRWGLHQDCWSSIRHQQMELDDKINNLRTVSAVDLELDDGIHISGKSHHELGRRLALMAGPMVYGKRTKPSPRISKIELLRPVEAGRPTVIRIICSNVEGKLSAPGKPTGFSILDPDNHEIMTIFRTEIHGSEIHLYTELNAEDVKTLNVAYGWGCQPYCTITDDRGLPLMATAQMKL